MPNRNEVLPVVIDTDAANEIDDQFAIAWALLASESLEVKAVHAAPFSHGVYMQNLARASALRGGAASRLERIAAAIREEDLAALSGRTPPADGMEKSHVEILRVFAACDSEVGTRVHRGSERFMSAPDDAVPSAAVDSLIALAEDATPERPLYVATIGAPTNVASALLAEPGLASRLVVLFVAGFPSGAGLVDDSFNLVQDRHASNAIFESRVRLVYMPGYQVAELLQLSLPDATTWLKGRGRLGDFLYETYRANALDRETEKPGRSWVLWDMITTAWLLNEQWVPTREVPRTRLDEEHRWQVLPESAGTMREAYRIDRNAAFADFFERLAEDS